MHIFFKIVFTIFLVSCGSSSGENNQDSPTGGLTGRWALTSISAYGKNIAFTGEQVLDFSEQEVVSYNEALRSSAQSEACWGVKKSTYKNENGILTIANLDGISASNCSSTDYNSNSKFISFADDSFKLSEDDIEHTYTKIAAEGRLEFEELAKKFESVSLEIQDSDLTGIEKFTYRNSKTSGWKSLCPRLAGEESSGFTSMPNFLYQSSVIDVRLQWDEGAITPNDYNGSAPGFVIEKRNSSSTDSVSVTGNSKYKCESVSDCASKCTLKVNEYSIIDRKALLEISCTNLAAIDNTDGENLFGSSISNLKLSISCNYKPTLE